MPCISSTQTGSRSSIYQNVYRCFYNAFAQKAWHHGAWPFLVFNARFCSFRYFFSTKASFVSKNKMKNPVCKVASSNCYRYKYNLTTILGSPSVLVYIRCRTTLPPECVSALVWGNTCGDPGRNRRKSTSSQGRSSFDRCDTSYLTKTWKHEVSLL